MFNSRDVNIHYHLEQPCYIYMYNTRYVAPLYVVTPLNRANHSVNRKRRLAEDVVTTYSGVAASNNATHVSY